MRHPMLTIASALALSAGTAAGQAGSPIRSPSGPITPIASTTLPSDVMAVLDATTRVVIGKASVRVTPTGDTQVRPVVDLAKCSGLEVGQSRRVDVPPLRWGVRSIPTYKGVASPFEATLTYTTVTSGLVDVVVERQAITKLAPGQERMFTFANATARPTSYTVTLILEVAFDRSANASGGNSVIVGNGPSRQRFCIASVDVIDRAMVVRADSANAVNDANRANNILTVR